MKFVLLASNLFALAHSKLEGFVSFKRSLLFPDDPERGNVLQPDYVLTYDYLAAHNFDPHATVKMALEEYALAGKPFQRITKDPRVTVQ